MEQSKENRGAIWANQKKEKPTHPDYTGSLNVNGVEYWVSAWRRKPDASPKAPALSFTVKPKDEQQSSYSPPKGRNDPISTGRPRQDDPMDDGVPFSLEAR